MAGAAVFVPLTTLFLVKYVGLDRLTNAYGLLSMIKGLATMTGPPIAGELHVSAADNILSDRYTNQGCICEIFTVGSQSFDWRLATIAGMEVAKLVPWNNLLN